MRHRRPKRYRYRSSNRGHQSRLNGGDGLRLRSQSFSNERSRNNFKPHQSAEKLFEKYNTLAKEALSSGDRILSENYFQHADHFMRIIDNKKLNQNQNSTNNNSNPTQQNNNSNPTQQNNTEIQEVQAPEKKDTQT